MEKFVSKKIKMKSGARLAAVQATYMIEYGQLPVDEVVRDFVRGEVGRYVIEDDELHHKEELLEVEEMDTNYFAEIARGLSSAGPMILASVVWITPLLPAKTSIFWLWIRVFTPIPAASSPKQPRWVLLPNSPQPVRLCRRKIWA